MKRMVMVSMLAAAVSAGGAELSAQTADETAIAGIVDELFVAMAERDTTTMRSLFADGARFAGVNPRTGAVAYTDPSDFLSAVASATGPAWIERTYDPEIRVDGPLGNVWVYYTLHVGDRFSHCGIDALQLLKVEGAWKIVHLADSRRQEGCTHTDPPAGS